MTTYTPNYAIPAPEATDPPAGHSQMQAIATTVDTSLYAVASRVLALEAGTGPDRKMVLKPADTAKSTDVTIASDPDLTLSLGAGTWQVTVGLHVTGTSGNFNMDFTTTGTANVQGRVNRGPGASNNDATDGTANMTGGDSAGTDQAFGTDNSAGTVEDSGVSVDLMLALTTSGSITVRWAQLASQASATTVKAGSWMTAVKFA